MVIKILCFGDSLTEGWIDDGRCFHPYTESLERLLSKENRNISVINSGISGETITVDMMKRLPSVLDKHPECDVLIIQGGTNDILQFLTLNSSNSLYQNLAKLINICVQRKISKVLILTTMEGYFVESDGATMNQTASNSLRLDFNQEIRKNIEQRSTISTQICICDMEVEFPMFNLSEKCVKIMWDDSLHPTAHGYDRMGEIIFQRLKSLSWI